MSQIGDKEHGRVRIDRVCIDRVAGGGFLCRLSADVHDADSNALLGTVRGAIGWRSEFFVVATGARKFGREVARLGRAADEIREADYRIGAEDQVDTVLLIERIELDGKPCGQLLAGAIVGHIVSLLSLDPLTTVVVITAGPDWSQDDIPVVAPPEGNDDVILAYQTNGFERWKNTSAWWVLRPVIDPGAR